jgi:uncharacterized protein (DUF58 family)
VAMAVAPSRALGVSVVLADVALFALAAWDAVRGRPRLVSVAREANPTFSLGRDNEVRLRLTSHATRDLRVQIVTDHDAALGPRTPPLTLTLAAAGTAHARYALRPTRRGLHEIGAHHVRHLTPLGLWKRQYRLEARTPVKVYPDVKAVRTYELLARQSREAILLRSARRAGQESEFERLREYSRDDAYRSIDWKATARKQKLIARTYQQERDQTVFAVLDAGRLMTAESDGLARFDHALNATLMLAHVAARGGDQVGLMAFDAEVRTFLAPVSGRRAAQRVLAASYALEARLTEPDFEVAFSTLRRRLKKRALIVFFTHVVDDVSAQALLRVVRDLGTRHLPLCIFLREKAVEALADGQAGPGGTRSSPADHAGDVGTSSPRDDLYARAAAAEILLARDKLVRDLTAAGAHVLLAEPGKVTPALINRYLAIKARTQL